MSYFVLDVFIQEMIYKRILALLSYNDVISSTVFYFSDKAHRLLWVGFRSNSIWGHCLQNGLQLDRIKSKKLCIKKIWSHWATKNKHRNKYPFVSIVETENTGMTRIKLENLEDVRVWSGHSILAVSILCSDNCL